MMQVLIGGAPGTGSSVLVRTLDRHSQLLAGPETFLFIHPKLYSDFKSSKQYLIRSSKFGGLKSVGWFRFNGSLLLDPYYLQNPQNLARIIQESPHFPAFAERFFQPALEKHRAQIWVEKSPSNVIGFEAFLEQFPEGRVIHTLRDPYDNIASLMARGYNAYYATAAVLMNQSFGLRSANHPRYQSIRYEALVSEPEAEITRLLRGLKLKFEPGQLIAESNLAEVEMTGWSQSERGQIKASEQSRFDQLDDQNKADILFLAGSIEIDPKYAAKFGLSNRTLSDICRNSQYPEKKSTGRPKNNYKRERLKDWWLRSIRFYPTGYFNYPIRLKSYHE
ncbi:MAG: sulfotransferase [Saprospiraceae bacterium]|nr:sulfotransferase [Saprospiraceae bacterium]